MYGFYQGSLKDLYGFYSSAGDLYGFTTSDLPCSASGFRAPLRVACRVSSKGTLKIP